MVKSLLEEVMTVSLRRGILYPSAEIYGGLAGFYDFGPIGARIRNRLVNLWRTRFVENRDFVYEISGNTLLPSPVFKASGHLDHFTDLNEQRDTNNSTGSQCSRLTTTT